MTTIVMTFAAFKGRYMILRENPVISSVKFEDENYKHKKVSA